MKLRHLEAALSSITREFDSPKVALEQYPTSAHLTACVIQLAEQKVSFVLNPFGEFMALSHLFGSQSYQSLNKKHFYFIREILQRECRE